MLLVVPVPIVGVRAFIPDVAVSAVIAAVSISADVGVVGISEVVVVSVGMVLAVVII